MLLLVLQLIPNTLPSVTIADGLRTSLSPLTFAHVRALVDDVALCAEAEILAAQRALMERTKLVVEPSGGVAMATALNLQQNGYLKKNK